nr:hypothetical protein [uncultured Butyrivibrio sp.]
MDSDKTVYKAYLIGAPNIYFINWANEMVFTKDAEVLASFAKIKLAKSAIFSGSFENTGYPVLVIVSMPIDWNEDLHAQNIPSKYLHCVFLKKDNGIYQEVIQNRTGVISLTDSALMDLKKS